MKRINRQQMSEIVSSFLEKRNYGDSNDVILNRKPLKSKSLDTKTSQSLAEVALKGSLVNSSSDSNVISLSQSIGDFSLLAENSFKQFIEFVERFKPKQRLFEQLCQLEFPLFLHIFIEMFECGHKMSARRFCRDYKNRFKEMSEQQIIGSMFTSLNNMSLESSLKNFKTSKYSIKISDKCLEQLKKYFKETNDLIVAQMVNIYIEFNLYSTHNQTENEKKFDSMNGRQSIKKNCQYNELDFMPSSDPSIDSLDSECKQMKRAIEKMRSTDPCVPPLCKYTINSTNVCSGAVADDMSAIAFGFEDSRICLKKFGPNNEFKTHSDIEVKRKTNEIHLNAINHNRDDSEDNTIDEEEPHNSLNTDKSMRTLRGHGGAVYDLTFVPKTNLLLSCSYDTTVRLWDTTTGNNVVTYNSHLAPVLSVDRIPFGEFFVTGAKDSIAYLWSLERSFPLRMFSGHSDSLNCVRFHPNCSFVATASADKEIKIWDIHKATAVRTLVGHEAPIYSMAFSTDGLYLASGGEDRKVKIWDLYSSQVIKEFSGHTDAVFSLSFNHCNEILASCGADQTLKIWNCSQVTSSSDKTHISEDSTQNPNRIRKEVLKSLRLESNVIYTKFVSKDLLVSIATKV